MKALVLALLFAPAFATAAPVYLDCRNDGKGFTVTLDESAGTAVHVTADGETHKAAAAFSPDKVVYTIVQSTGTMFLKSTVTVSRIDLTADFAMQIDGKGEVLQGRPFACAIAKAPERKF